MPGANTPSHAYQRWSSLLVWAGVCTVFMPCWGQSQVRQGVVKDTTGAAIVGAEVRYTSSSGQESVTATDGQGRFRFDGPVRVPGVFQFRAKGFETVRREISGSTENELVITLAPLTQREDVVVSAARTEVRLAETPGSTVLLSETDIMSTPALRVDDARPVADAATLGERAVALLEPLAGSRDPRIRAESQLRLARNYRKRGRVEAALAAYARLGQERGVRLDGVPAELVLAADDFVKS